MKLNLCALWATIYTLCKKIATSKRFVPFFDK